MPGLGWQELVIVLIIVIIIFGAGKLPEIGGAVGKSIKEFKNASDDESQPLASTTTDQTDKTKVATPAQRPPDLTGARSDDI